MRVSVAPIAMQCKVCEPLLIFARAERMRMNAQVNELVKVGEREREWGSGE